MNSIAAREGARADAQPWTSENQRGLSLAAGGDWNGAAAAFGAAVEALSANEAQDPVTHNALALVLSNLAQASFHVGEIETAVRHAQRVCALRAALCGEDAVSVARARSDLAVMLAASGRVDEAPALIARALAGIEHSVGDESLLLAVVLENAARVALANGQPASAEPHLLRLHGLLGQHDIPTARADVLLARVADARADAELRAQIEQSGAGLTVLTGWDGERIADAAATATTAAAVTPERVLAIVQDREREFVQDEAQEIAQDEAHETVQGLADESVQDMAHEGVLNGVHDSVQQRVHDSVLDEADEWDDQPLRDAVELTDVLLRSTPSGSPLVRAEPDAVDPWSTAAGHEVPAEEDVFGADLLELTDALHPPVVAESPSSARDASAVPFGNADDSAVTLVDHDVPPDRDHGLGFVVQYGTPLDSGMHLAMPERAFVPPRPRSSAEVAGEAADGAPMMEREIEQDIEHIDMPTPPAAVPAVAAPLALPVAAAGQAPDGTERRKTPRGTSSPLPSPADVRRAPRVPGAQPTKSRWPLIGGGIGAILIALAGWWFTNGGF